jgi:hypothetical protein
MGHGILERDFQVAETMAWHNLTLLEKPTINHFPEIECKPLWFDTNSPAAIGDKEYYIPVSTRDGLPVAPPYCKQTYTLFQPREAWKWVESILEGTHYNIESIGMLWNQSFWFMSVSLDELKTLSIGDGRKTNFQFNFSGGLDKATSPQAELSSIVAVCNNTISLSRLTGKVLFKERATKNFNQKLDIAKDEIEKAIGMSAVFKAAMDSVAKNPCNRDKARELFTGFLTTDETEKLSTNTRNSIDELTELHDKGLGNSGKSEFDALNAFTQFRTHGKANSKSPMGKRFASSEFGGNSDEKARFARVLTIDRDDQYDSILNRGKALLKV